MAHPGLLHADLEATLAALHEASFGWARSCCNGDADEGADVLQTCYAKLITGQAVYSGRSSFRTWLFGVIRFTAMEARRKRARDLVIPGWLDAPESPVNGDTLLIDAEETEELRRALNQLADRQHEVVHLVFYQGLSVAEAADVMELSIGSARVHYDRAKKRLRTLLSAQFKRDA